MTPLALAFAATTWACSSPMEVHPNPDILPIAPLKLELSARLDAQFEASGLLYDGRLFRDITWTGQWTEYDGGLALIGHWKEGRAKTEARATSTGVRPQAIFMRLRTDGGTDTTLRCLQATGGL